MLPKDKWLPEFVNELRAAAGPIVAGPVSFIYDIIGVM